MSEEKNKPYEKADIFCPLVARMLHRTQKLNQHFLILSGNKKTVVCVFHMKKTNYQGVSYKEGSYLNFWDDYHNTSAFSRDIIVTFALCRQNN